MSGNDWYSPKHEAEAAKARRVYFPIVTSIVLSVVFGRFFGRWFF
jgi:hypothetical protein